MRKQDEIIHIQLVRFDKRAGKYYWECRCGAESAHEYNTAPDATARANIHALRVVIASLIVGNQTLSKEKMSEALQALTKTERADGDIR